MTRPPRKTLASASDLAPLLAAARRDDAVAIDELFRRFYPRVQHLVHRDLSRDLRTKRPWLSSRFSTGDVVQEVFRKLLRNLNGIEADTEAAFCGYLSVVIRNRLLDAIRFHEAARRDGRRTVAWSEELVLISQQGGPGGVAVSAEDARTYDAAS